MPEMPDRGYINVVASADLAPGQLREVRGDDYRLVVGRLYTGEVVAFWPLCPHEAAPLADGTIRGNAIDCPRHHYLFDLRTGANTFLLPIYSAWKRAQVGDLSLRLFPVVDREGWIAVDSETDRAPASNTTTDTTGYPPPDSAEPPSGSGSTRAT